MVHANVQPRAPCLRMQVAPLPLRCPACPARCAVCECMHAAETSCLQPSHPCSHMLAQVQTRCSWTAVGARHVSTVWTQKERAPCRMCPPLKRRPPSGAARPCWRLQKPPQRPSCTASKSRKPSVSSAASRRISRSAAGERSFLFVLPHLGAQSLVVPCACFLPRSAQAWHRLPPADGLEWMAPQQKGSAHAGWAGGGGRCDACAALTSSDCAVCCFWDPPLRSYTPSQCEPSAAGARWRGTAGWNAPSAGGRPTSSGELCFW